MRASLSLAGPLLLAATPVLAASCPPPAGAPPPEIRVSLSTGVAAPVYSGELSLARIAALAGNPRLGRGSFITGLTRSSTKVAITPQIWQVDMGGGRRCVGLGRVEATWRLDPIRVDIASKYPPGGCNYRVIRAHEDEHVAIARRTFQDWTPRLEKALADSARAILPLATGADGAAAVRQLTGRLMQGLQPVLDAYEADLNARDGAIDTEANYHRLNRLCPTW
ncbi:hypothetical protein [Magnetospirillum sp. SS-4]|uniref:hypothetical protein n=1 Tax=Magnetospirillum sp. SS-4 TaxID=2681465 RepID=UPI0013842192|nr:hypothetical protein [Magnetospirillum sp. SS-4]CAA7616899.1 conserved exported hypothetical protein [Magnetospirillum sp. SS-4]